MGKTKKNKPKKAEPSSSDNDNELQLPETAKSVPSSTSSSNSKPLKQFHRIQMPKATKNLKAESLTEDQKHIVKKECQSMFKYKHNTNNFISFKNPNSHSRNLQSIMKSNPNIDSKIISISNASKSTVKKPSADEINSRLQRMNAAKIKK